MKKRGKGKIVPTYFTRYEGVERELCVTISSMVIGVFLFVVCSCITPSSYLNDTSYKLYYINFNHVSPPNAGEGLDSFYLL